MDTALVLSPATTFMSATQYNYQDSQTKERIITFGPMSSINEVATAGRGGGGEPAGL